MKILVSDSERGFPEKVKAMLEQNIKNVEVLLAKDDKQEIMHIAMKERPAVCILGVDLKGLNGLDTAREMRERNLLSEIIITSYYNFFDFTKAALKYQIHDYILKPVLDGEFLKSVKEAVCCWEEKQEIEERKRKLEEYVEESKRHTAYAFIYEVLFNGHAKEELRKYQKYFRLSEEGYVLNIEIDSLDTESAVERKQDDEAMYQCLHDIISSHCRCVIGPRILNRILVWIDVSTMNVKMAKTRRAENDLDDDTGSIGPGIKRGSVRVSDSMDDIRLAAHIIVGMKEQFRVNALVGIGSVVTLLRFHNSYEEAVRCLRYRGGHNVVRISDVELGVVSRKEYTEHVNQLIKNIKFGKAETMNRFIEVLDMIRPLGDNIRKNKIYEILILADYEAKLLEKSELNYLDIYEGCQETKDMTPEEMEQWAYLKFEYIVNYVQASRLQIKSDVVNSAIRYMEEHYMEELTLEEIAKYVGITPQHFSKTFKEETGINYIDWLTNLRIDVAKRLLIEGKNTIKEICYLSGYHDPNYFSRIFRKTVGVSPSSYAGRKSPEG